MARRTVEVFTAGCEVCDDALQLLRTIICESCDLHVHEMRTDTGMAKARQYGVTRVPSVVVDGRLADCCKQGGFNESILRGLGVGTRS